MRIQFLSVLLLAALFFQCKKDAPLPTAADLAGKWKQVQVTGEEAFGGQDLTIDFKADGTFQMERRVWSDVLTEIGDTCSIRTDYIAGKYLLENSNLQLEGEFYDSFFKNLVQHCTGETQYRRTSEIQLADGELIIFPSLGHPKARMQRK